jgi:ABC-type amino acid transport substrate-binding protein
MNMILAVWRRAAEFGVLLFLTATLLSGTASAGAVDRIRQDNVLRIAYRPDAPPFPYKNSNDEPAGFMLGLCRAVATHCRAASSWVSPSRRLLTAQVS